MELEISSLLAGKVGDEMIGSSGKSMEIEGDAGDDAELGTSMMMGEMSLPSTRLATALMPHVLP
jgi:hypothetical protein